MKRHNKNRDNTHTFSFRAEDAVADKLIKIAADRKVSHSMVLGEALEKFVKEYKHERNLYK